MKRITFFDADELCTPHTLTVVHICDGEEVVVGGEDGQAWVATFASQNAAAHFVKYAVEQSKSFYGLRRCKTEVEV